MQITDEDIKQAKKIIGDFKKHKTDEEVFYNFCFCILVPQTKFSATLKIVEHLKQLDFLYKDVDELPEIIKASRYKNRKAKYLLEMKQKFSQTIDVLRSLLELKFDSFDIRKYLIYNIKGMSFKASSHFLRNLGVEDLAIVDIHILNYFKIEKKSKWDYIEVENKMKKLAKKHNVSIAVLDALIWKSYSKTNWENFIY